MLRILLAFLVLASSANAQRFGTGIRRPGGGGSALTAGQQAVLDCLSIDGTRLVVSGDCDELSVDNLSDEAGTGLPVDVATELAALGIETSSGVPVFTNGATIASGQTLTVNEINSDAASDLIIHAGNASYATLVQEAGGGSDVLDIDATGLQVRDGNSNGGFQVQTGRSGETVFISNVVPLVDSAYSLGSNTYGWLEYVGDSVEAASSGGVALKDSSGVTQATVSAGGVGIAGDLHYGAPAVTPISSGTLTQGDAVMYAAAAETGTSDELDNISAGTVGQVVWIYADTGDTITIRDNSTGSGNLYTCSGGNVVITDADSPAGFAWNNGRSAWYQLGCDNP